MADNEYAIWKAIGSLTQRVRDLEQPAPEPPKCPNCDGTGEVRGGSYPPNTCDWVPCPTCHGKPDPTIRQDPEASQPSPAEVEAAKTWAKQALFSALESDPNQVDGIVDELVKRLAALWPKAGQVPSKAELQVWLTKHSDSGIPMEDGENLHKWLLSRMGQPAPLPPQSELDKCAADELRRIEAKAQPVTAEKLARFLAKLNAFEYDALMPEMQGLYDERAKRLLQAFPALGQGRLTRAQIEPVFEDAFPNYSQGYRSRVADDILARQGQAKVSKEQWAKLVKGLPDQYYNDDPSIAVDWMLKELGAEVAG